MQQTPAVAHTYQILFLLVDAIERGKVDVGGCFVDVDVLMRCAKDAENNEELAGA